MNLKELMHTSLMKNAKVIAGKNGLYNDVTGCVQERYLNRESWFMPGLMFLCMEGWHALSSLETLNFFLEMKISGIVLFDDFDVDDIDEMCISFCNSNKIPLISIKPGVSIASFSKMFVSVIASRMNSEYCQMEWLYNVCHSKDVKPYEDYGELYGYSQKCKYYCLLVSLKINASEEAMEQEMILNRARYYLEQAFSNETAKILYFFEKNSLVAFLPRFQKETVEYFRNKVYSVADQIRKCLIKYDWEFVLGSRADNITRFERSYLHTKQISAITVGLDIDEGVRLWSDWYIYIVMLKEAPQELYAFMEANLEPILNMPELLDTLYYYVFFNGNLKTVAGKLFIHVNTLKYRLQRLMELLDCDLKDPDTIFKYKVVVILERYFRKL